MVTDQGGPRGTTVIYHNPNCSTSCKRVNLLQGKDFDHRIAKYFECATIPERANLATPTGPMLAPPCVNVNRSMPK
ncbi:hypothetical protein MLPF_0334 [Mycobacterium lepromatosis]|uniref:Arsenate reductase n=1 Tax=Mycobacterium lepromatosis TaxID=480418 RepID=A0A0F4ESG7_9MYCO|nr:arsenate reductase [Mycobacterium lepromatosis]UKN41630.1 hypothetical protein MLPF_0334 [Mycobacterium lepromatosis]